ncbi:MULTISPECIES: hypothetical protein [Clostridium]|uniref:Uncharacterized protein n=1 Tax=Clostridium cibarium TaxID=2762247 RepID=A0ABR8PTB2_9CLOT|nr:MULTISPECIES: hypothetical protein [Clostridium]MBD7911418.1 hypothetical protein [Clostridium cibarium]
MNEELASYKMSAMEEEKWNSFKKEIIDDCKKINIPDKLFNYVDDNLESKYYQHSCGYSEKKGYFKIDFGDRGSFVVDILEKDYEEARFAFLERILWSVSVEYECINRKKFEKKWNYKVDYDGRKHFFEYTIRSLNVIFPYKKLEEYISSFCEHMNRWFYIKHWDFNKENMEFEEISDSEEHSFKGLIRATLNNKKQITELDFGNKGKNSKIIIDGLVDKILEFDRCFAIKVKFEENNDKHINKDTKMDNILIYNYDGEFLWDVQSLTKCQDSFAQNIMVKDNNGYLRVNTSMGKNFCIDVNSKAVLEGTMTK